MICPQNSFILLRKIAVDTLFVDEDQQAPGLTRDSVAPAVRSSEAQE